MSTDDLLEELHNLVTDDRGVDILAARAAAEIKRLTAANYKLQADVAYLAAWKDEIEKGLARMEGDTQ